MWFLRFRYLTPQGMKTPAALKDKYTSGLALPQRPLVVPEGLCSGMFRKVHVRDPDRKELFV